MSDTEGPCNVLGAIHSLLGLGFSTFLPLLANFRGTHLASRQDGKHGKGHGAAPSAEEWLCRCSVLATLQDAERREDSQRGNWIKKIGLHKNHTCLRSAQRNTYVYVLAGATERKMHIFLFPSPLGVKCLRGRRAVTHRQLGRFLVVHRSSCRAETSF